MYTLPGFKGNAVSYIDAHCHIDFEAFDADRGAALARAGAQGIRRFLIAGVSYSHWSRQSRVAATHPGMFCSVGLHPVYLSQLNEAAVLEQLSGIESLLRSGQSKYSTGRHWRDRSRPGSSLKVDCSAATHESTPAPRVGDAF